MKKLFVLGVLLSTALNLGASSYIDSIAQKYYTHGRPAINHAYTVLSQGICTLEPGMGPWVQKAVESYYAFLVTTGAAVTCYALKSYRDACATARHHQDCNARMRMKKYVNEQLQHLQQVLDTQGEDILSFEHIIAKDYSVAIHGDNMPYLQIERQLRIITTEPNNDPEYASYKFKKTTYTLTAHQTPLEYCTYQ